MGFTRARLKVANFKRTKEMEMIFLADSGSRYLTMPPKLAQELDIAPLTKTTVTTADKREIEIDVSIAHLEGLGRKAVVFVAILDAPEPLLGVEALEALGLSIDPATGELKTTRPYGVLL